MKRLNQLKARKDKTELYLGLVRPGDLVGKKRIQIVKCVWPLLSVDEVVVVLRKPRDYLRFLEIMVSGV